MAALNAQRKANGIPAGIRLSSLWSGRCHKHDHYMELNRQLTHVEEPGKTGYRRVARWRGGTP